MFPRYAVVGIALLTVGCVGSNHWYKADAEFQTYIDGLHLHSMTMERAEAKLIQEGFKCELDSAGRKCERIYEGGYGGQWQHVLISADPNDAGRSNVSISLTGVVI
jgi:hypothetical protein